MAKKRTKRTSSFIYILGLGCVMIGLTSYRNYTFVNAFPFSDWYVVLTVVIIAGLLFGLTRISKKIQTTDVIVLFILLSLLSMSVFAHLNHTLDSEEPERYTVTILDKERSGGRKSGRTYRFTVMAEGRKIDIKVPRHHYSAFDEGDLYVVEYHQGAFNQPYYIGIGGLE